LLDELDSFFVSERTGQEDERYMRTLLLHDLKGALSGEARQREIGKDHFWTEGSELLNKRRLRVHDDSSKVEARTGQEALLKISIGRLVLEDEDS
jgi:hypothetical protein